MNNMVQGDRATGRHISSKKKDYNYLSKNNFGRVIRLIVDSDYRFNVASILGLTRFMSDEKYLKRIFKMRLGYDLDLDNPQTFNEKLQWLKIHDRKPEYTLMADKYEAKKYAAKIIGEEHIIPTLGVYNNFDEINFDELPEQFVLKCNHDSGSIVIVRDKNNFDKAHARKFLNKKLKRNYFWTGREWPYKDIKPKIIAEQYMEDSVTHDLRDYKFFTFDGVAKAMFIATDRQNPNEETKFDFYDMDFKHLDFRHGHPNANIKIARPEKFDEMRELAEKLSAKLPQLRVDFYEVNGKIYFGELTFSHNMGMVAFEPFEWDKKFGEWITLPECNGGGVCFNS